ncbi:DUF3455 domain-containing protein [Aspergillus mulundensis]|uniref:Malate dehydrogenase n=1 Tax=Aspergillus mulundensis TaxID=1810919 RepID=A0A3D8RYU5_9EURO|nr:hypothetical protein DSM5745_05853 [Aspergillus mulundensis]RDW79001.1 hypothetical protein DSM5745_05853 [Aspergillus mulundensis]
MNWATFTLVSLLSITTVNALPFSSAATSSFYTSIVSNFLQNTQLTGCPITDTTTLASSTLTAPSKGLSAKAITLGRGTQNYTCASSSNLATPKATGATATLFDASCVAAFDARYGASTGSQSILHLLPDVLKPVPLSTTDLSAIILQRLSKQDLVVGKHYFTADGTPFFDLRGAGRDNSDWIAARKADQMDAPSKPGFGITGDVAWLKLTAVEGGYREVYRVHTAGGSAPATCEGMPAEFTVDYTAEYWFYG